jgi:hypothetical protein
MSIEKGDAIAPHVNPQQSAALVPMSDIREMAKAAAASGLFPSARTPEAAMTLMLLCQAEGLHPIQALRRYHIIDGTPSMRTDAMLASFQERGGRVKWIRTDEEVCEAMFSHQSSGDVTVKWTLEDAKRAGIASKQNWGKYPRQMLRARVISEGVRMCLPEVVVGICSEEEVRDLDPQPSGRQQPAPIDVHLEPVPPAKASPAQVRALAIALKEAGIADSDRFDWMSSRVGHQVASSKDLTAEEASRLINEAKAAKPAEREPGEDDA